MQTTVGTRRVTKGELGLASVLLAGVLVIAYGYFRPNGIAFYTGLLLTIGGVLTGVVHLVTRDV